MSKIYIILIVALVVVGTIVSAYALYDAERDVNFVPYYKTNTNAEFLTDNNITSELKQHDLLSSVG